MSEAVYTIVLLSLIACCIAVAILEARRGRTLQQPAGITAMKCLEFLLGGTGIACVLLRIQEIISSDLIMLAWMLCWGIAALLSGCVLKWKMKSSESMPPAVYHKLRKDWLKTMTCSVVFLGIGMYVCLTRLW